MFIVFRDVFNILAYQMIIVDDFSDLFYALYFMDDFIIIILFIWIT